MGHLRSNSLKYVGIALILVSAVAARAQVLRGSVTNGTTKKPVPGAEVVLLRLDKGMDEETRTKADSKGQFSFELPDSQTMRAVRARYENVNYFQPVTPGSTSVVVTVYESSPTVAGVQRTNQFVVFRAQGNELDAYEVFNLTNNSNPPRTQPAFDFYLPEGATVETAQAMREGGMALKVAPVPQSGNKYMIMYPLFPGQTHFQVVYKLPYSGNFKYQPKFAGPVGSFYVVTPKSMGFTPEAGSQYQTQDADTLAPDLKGMDLHVAKSTADDSKLAFQIAGEGLIPETNAQQAAPQSNAQNTQQEASDTRPGIGLGVPNDRPNPLTSAQPLLLLILTLFMAGGGAFVFMSSRPSTAATAQPHAQASAAPLLDALKEEMFQLETDRLQGRISGTAYDAAKAALDKTLHRAMKNRVNR